MGQRLPDSVAFFSRKFREIRMFVTNPVAILRMQAWRRARSIYENTELPGGEDQDAKQDSQYKESNNGDRPTSSQRASYEVNHDGRAGEFIGSDSSNLSNSEELKPSDWVLISICPMKEGDMLKGGQWYQYKIGKLIREEPYGQ